MNDMNMNIYGFTKPTTKAEYIKLLDEALRLADELSLQLDCIDTALGESEALNLQ